MSGHLIRLSCAIGLLALLCGKDLRAAVQPGENLLLNGRFECDQVDFPPEWTLYPPQETTAEWNPSAGPKGLPSLSLVAPEDVDSPMRSVRQVGLSLHPTGRYRLSCWVRTRGFSCKGSSGVVVANMGWEASRGIGGIPPEAENRWVELKADFEGFPSSNGKYLLVIYAQRFTGTLEFADIRLVPLDEQTARHSARPVLSPLAVAPRIVPWSGLLGEIPAESRAISFRLLGELPKDAGADGYDMVLETGCESPVTQALNPDGNRFILPGRETNGVVAVRLACRKTGSNVVSRTFRYRVAPSASKENLSRHVRLNNLVTEVLRAKSDGADRAYSFGLRKGGWVFISAGGKAEGDRLLSVTLDGRDVIRPSTPRRETFREISAGDHRLFVSGLPKGESIIVRKVPELYNNCLAGPPLRAVEPHDEAFFETHVMPAMTTAEFVEPKCGLDEFHARGHQFVKLGDDSPLKSPEDMLARLRALNGLDRKFDKLSLAEQFFWQTEKNAWYMDSLRRYETENVPERPYHCWWIGKPVNGIANAEALSVCANAAWGRSLVMLELYCRTRQTEDQAIAYLSDYVRDTIVRCQKTYPPVMGNLGAILCDSAGTPSFSVAHHPEVDYRYYLEMQMRMLAFDPALDGLGCVGYWGSYYADRENLTWAFRLLRHYCVEGRTDSLSEHLGLRYNPGHLVNGDFRDGLEGWETIGIVGREVFRGLGEKSEGRWEAASGLGDACAVMTRGEKPNWISQRMTGLEPGRRYYLRFYAFDVRDLGTQPGQPRHVGVDVRFGKGVRVDKKSGWVNTELSQVRQDVMHPNLHHVEFVAEDSTCRIGFTDASAQPGERHGINGIGIYPCLSE